MTIAYGRSETARSAANGRHEPERPRSAALTREAALRGMEVKMNFGKIKTSFEAAAKNAGLLGTLFWWDLGNNRVAHAEFARRASDAGLDPALLPAAVKASTAFKRAWRAAARRVSDELLLREIADTVDQIVVAVVREDPDVLNLDLRYQVLARAAFSKKTETLTLLENHAILDALPTLFDHFSALTTEDIRAMVLAFVRKSGLSIRHAGGVYFIPPELSPTLAALCDVLRAVGTNTVWTLPIADLGDASATLGALAKETLDEEVATVEAELAAFNASDVKTRDSTLERRLKRFEEIRGRANLMAGALSFRADSLLDNIAKLEEEVRRRLLGDSERESAHADATEDARNNSAPFDVEAGF
jgi:hypothetical protein